MMKKIFFDNKEEYYVKIKDALDHLVANEYCKINKCYIQPQQPGWSGYWAYRITDEMLDKKPSYVSEMEGVRTAMGEDRYTLTVEGLLVDTETGEVLEEI